MLTALTGRAICNLGFVERPIVIGLAWWMITGEASPALPLALFFELFWLDLFPIGGYIPPMPAFPYLLLLALHRLLGWADPMSLAFPLAVSLPLAYAVPFLETWQRNQQKNASKRLIRSAKKSDTLEISPGRLVFVSALEQWGMILALYFCIYIPLVSLFFLLPALRQQPILIPLDVDWSVLYAIAAIGSLLALRLRRVYLTFALCMAAFLAFKVI